MVIAGLRSAQKLLQVHLTGGRREKVPPPDHLRDPGRGIIHHHGQLIYEYSIRPADHKIAAVPGKIFYVLALNSVPEGDLPVRYPNPPGGQAAKGGPLLRLSIPAPAVIYIDAIGGVRSVNPVQAAAGAVAGVKKPHLLQKPKGGLVGLLPLALGCGLPVPGEAQPGEVPAELAGVTRIGTLSVQIFHT
jgi:hypothetical protein